MKILAISPHLDDAAFSAGGLLAARSAEGWEVTVTTCFTGNVTQPTGFALACQTDKGLPAELDYMELRRREDIDACRELRAQPIHLPFLEAPHRGYESAKALFGTRLENDGVVHALTKSLVALIACEQPDIVLGPLCLGDHVDHHVVRDAITSAVDRERLLLWEDWPYADRECPVGILPALIEPLTESTRSRRIAACAAYRSQLGFQFGGVERMTERITAISEERYYRLPPA